MEDQEHNWDDNEMKHCIILSINISDLLAHIKHQFHYLQYEDLYGSHKCN
jgi:hypothetical protein